MSPPLADVSVNLAAPAVASVTVIARSTGTSIPFGGQSTPLVGSQVTSGGVASRFHLTDAEAVPPWLVAVQVSVSRSGRCGRCEKHVVVT